MEPNVFTELLSPVNHELCDAWSPLKSTQNPFFPSDFSEVRTIAKVHSCSYHLDRHARYFGRRIAWRHKLLLYRRIPCMALVTKSMVKQDKQDLQVSDWQITVKHRKKKKCQGTEKNLSPRSTWHWGKSHGHPFSISHRLCNKWACDQVIPSLIFFYKDRESFTVTQMSVSKLQSIALTLGSGW